MVSDTTLRRLEPLLKLFREQGHHAYIGEDVTQTEHMLQSAHQAMVQGRGDEVILAALLHDVGHFTHAFDEDCADHGIDSRHEHTGADFLTQFFPPSITEPVRLHVDAKRYLCATQQGYLASLSPASLKSLHLQGGPMTEEEVAAFEANPHFQAAADLRRADDGGKVPGAEPPTLDAFLPLMEKFLFTT